MNDSEEFAGEGRSALDSMFSPKSVALIGATDREGSVGRTVLERLRITSFRGRIFPVNPNHRDVLGLPACPKIGDIPEKVDLAVIVTPRQDRPRRSWRMRGRRSPRSRRDLRGLQGTRA